MKIRPVGAKLLHADGETNMAKFNSRFFTILRARLKVGAAGLSS